LDKTLLIPGVDLSVGWFNAAMTMTTRGLMKAELSGEFSPHAPVTGAGLLLAVVTLRDVLKFTNNTTWKVMMK
jgi:hypothetical protein